MISLEDLANANELLGMHNRSLASYLADARPWHNGRADQEAAEVLAEIVADQRSYVDELGRLIVDNDGVVDYGEYPIRFTAYNDLSYDWVLQHLRNVQQADARRIGDIAARIEDPEVRAVAEQAAGAAQGHLRSLEELLERRQKEPGAAT